MKNKLFVLAFFILICAPCVAGTLLADRMDRENYENRTLASMPGFSLSTISEYPSKLDEYFNDNLPFKNELVRANSVLEVKLFHTSPSGEVILGKDGWLFFDSVREGDPIGDYMDRKDFGDGELKDIADRLETSRRNLEAEGRELVLFIAPNKERVYWEKMPDYYGPPAENCPARRIVDYLRQHTGVKVVYAYDAIMAEKERLGGERDLYLKTDTHWNALGAYVGARELLDVLGVELPALEAMEDQIVESDANPGGLSRMMNIGANIDPGKRYSLRDYDGIPQCDSNDYLYENEGADSRRVVVFRDSFCTAMSQVLGSSFSRCRMVHWNVRDNDVVRQEDADVLVLEIVERHLQRRLKKFVYGEAA